MMSVFAPIHKDGMKFVLIFAAISILLYSFSHPLGVIGFILTAWCIYFFRIPKRVTPIRDGLIVSPADGIVSLIADVVPPKEYDIGTDPLTRVSIFLNVFDVHIQRTPIAGTVEKIIYHPGKFLNASLDKASEDNERQTIVINNGKFKIACTQIAGLVARRILCQTSEGKVMNVGELYGLIRFGSRVDVYLPKGVAPLVIIGQRMIGGETILADLMSTEARRQGSPN
ncbi:phosphatidylserine decarboxylase [Candidatus Odyssella acanthamoebae]|uniref:Phosphatidylserine decarboxylase proenzyme n=1 Tax=Candidatus Odyssella acanthamoebae TaxID=91604 RepID=A0A077AVG9_9PROT|nr:phosphatidylserine decarboxylase [Candidatus Paracaedibacter acanthamoebae]AIK96034.1 phosphatidylserine decarboxylase [Candidatus Paracaedibacter acanthamoebae]